MLYSGILDQTTSYGCSRELYIPTSKCPHAPRWTNQRDAMLLLTLTARKSSSSRSVTLFGGRLSCSLSVVISFRLAVLKLIASSQSSARMAASCKSSTCALEKTWLVLEFQLNSPQRNLQVSGSSGLMYVHCWEAIICRTSLPHQSGCAGGARLADRSAHPLGCARRRSASRS